MRRCCTFHFTTNTIDSLCCVHPLHLLSLVAKLVDTGTFDEDEEVVFDDMVDEYDDEDEAIDAVSCLCSTKCVCVCMCVANS